MNANPFGHKKIILFTSKAYTCMQQTWIRITTESTMITIMICKVNGGDNMLLSLVYI